MSERTVRIDGVDYAVESAVRFDRTQFGPKPRLDKQTGFLHVPATLTRAPAVFAYQNGDGTIRREFRDAVDVYSPENLERMATGVITMDHPPVSVNAENIKDYGVGHGNGNIKVEDGHAVLGLIVTEKTAIDGILTGKTREVSNGYDCDVIAMPGVYVDASGVEHPYDVKQVNHRNNHIALVQHGRAGTAKIHMDSAHAVQVLDSDSSPPPPPPPRVKPMENTDTDQLKQRLDALEKQLADERSRADKLEAAKDVLAQAQIKESRVDAQAQMNAAIRERFALLKSAQSVGRFDSAGMSALEALDNLEIKRKALDACGINTTGKNEHYVDAAFDLKLAEAQSSARSVHSVDKLGAELASLTPAPAANSDEQLMKRIDAAMEATNKLYLRPVSGGFTRDGLTRTRDTFST